MSPMLVAPSPCVHPKTTSNVATELQICAGQVWTLSSDFTALKSTSDRLVSSDLARFSIPRHAKWRLSRIIAGFSGGCVVLQLIDGTPVDSKAGRYLYIRMEELAEFGTCPEASPEPTAADGLYRVLSATGRVLGYYENRALARAAMRHWSQAVSVVCGTRVIARKEAERVAA